MALVRWEPLREINSLQREMNRLFDTMMPTDIQPMTNGNRFMPVVEMHDTADAIQLKVELPGIDTNDLEIQATAEAISISGERKSETKTEDNGVLRSEFSYGKFQRVLPLPARIQNDKVQAQYKDGILHLTLPKAEHEKNRVVKVNLG